MADLSDVEVAFVGALTAALYPAGVNMPSITGAPARVFRGWPLIGPLERDLAAGVSNVSVFPVPGTGRNVTRWGPQTHVVSGACSLTAEASGCSATFGGTGGSGQVAGLLVDGQPFVYRSVAGDTAVVVSAVLAEAVRALRACWLSATTLTVPSAKTLVARVAADGMTSTEWARQSQDIRISVWCPNPTQRDLTCAQIGSVLAQTPFLIMADNSSGRIRYSSTTTIDDGQDIHQYRRDLIYEAEYATLAGTVSPAMLFGDSTVDSSSIYI